MPRKGRGKAVKGEKRGVATPSKAVPKRYNLRGALCDEGYDADSEGDICARPPEADKALPILESPEEHSLGTNAMSDKMQVDEPEGSCASGNTEQLASVQRIPNYNAYLLNSLRNKENLTPPETHSTPASKPAKRADDSLFGFNMLDSPLPFSPVVGPVTTRVPTSPALSCVSDSLSGTVASAISPLKRKLGFGFYDIPIEVPKKKQRRKPVKKKQAEGRENGLEKLRKEFQEIEMHELAIE